MAPGWLAIDSSGDVYVADQGAGVVDKFTSAGGYVSQLDGSSTPQGSFFAGALAVDSSGDLYVADQNTGVVDKFTSAGGYVSQIDGSSTPQGSFYAGALALDSSGDLYVGDQTNGVVDEFGSSGNYLSQFNGSGTPQGSFYPQALAVDGTGNVYVADANHSVVDRFDSSGNYLSQFDGSTTPQGSFSPIALATDGAGNVAVADASNSVVDVFSAALPFPDVTTGAATNVTETSVTLNGTVNPDGVQLNDCHFEYGTDTSYGQSAPCVPAAASIPADSNDHAVSANLTGIASGTTYHFRLVAANANGTIDGQDRTFATPGPTLQGTWSTDVGSSDATLHASLNPNGTDATYHFEYGTSTAYGTSLPVPDADAGSGTTTVTVSQLLTGLAADTAYHYRIVATDAAGTVDGPDRILTTKSAPSSGTDSCPNATLRTGYSRYLPDCRAYEQVSPVDKNSYDAALVTQGNLADLARASTDGSKLFFETFGDAFAGEPSGQTDDTYMSQRGADGWSTTGINPPMNPSTALIDQPYIPLAFTDTLDQGVTDSPAGSPLTPDSVAGQDNQYVSNLSNPSNPSYELVTTAAEPHPSVDTAQFDGASTDLTHVLFSVNDSLTADSPSLSRTASNLYESASGQLHLVNVDPAGTPVPVWFKSISGLSPTDVSADGSRVVFVGCRSFDSTDGACLAQDLFVRVNPTQPASTLHGTQCVGQQASACTVQLDTPQGSSGAGGGGEFLAASADGSKVLFSDDASAGLTTDTVPGSGKNLYLADLATGTLSDLTPAPAAGVDGLLAMSAAGGDVYFVANGALAGGAVDGKPNLYLTSGGTTRFVATLDPSDKSDWQAATGGASGVPYGPVNVTPDGTHVVFQSVASLTGFDNTDANTGQPDSQVYVYDATRHVLRCASCNPTGARPEGASTLSTEAYGSSGVLSYTPRSISSDGSRVFFNSTDALTGRDTNSLGGCTTSGNFVQVGPCQDVYEWEAQGTGSCASASADGGCLDLISSGSSDNAAEFLDASANGNDVFFVTRDQLVGQDQDQLYDVYDARVDGGIASQNPAAGTSCSGDSCRGQLGGTPAPPTVATVTFSGPGNQSAPGSGGKVGLVTHTVRGARFLIAVKAPGPGRLTISGAEIGTVSRTVTHAGTDKLRVALTRKAGMLLARRHRLRLTLRVRYAPPGAGAQTAIVRLLVKPAVRHRTHGGRRASFRKPGGAR